MKLARHIDSISVRDGFVSPSLLIIVNCENTSSGSFAALVLETQDKSDVETESDGKVGAAGMETTRTSYFMETVAYNLQSEM